MKNGIFLLLGSNMGDKAHHLSRAIEKIEERCGSIKSRSSVYRTSAWGNTDQEDFFNQVVQISTALPPDRLLAVLLTIERDLGRKRTEKWGPRTIDIDILFYNNQIIDTPLLVVPHPGIPLRKFALVPLAEVAREFVHPILKKTVGQLLSESPDELEVKKIT